VALGALHELAPFMVLGSRFWVRVPVRVRSTDRAATGSASIIEQKKMWHKMSEADINLE
jgi:hypothetical protein